MPRKKGDDRTEWKVLLTSLLIVAALMTLAFNLSHLFPVGKDDFNVFLETAEEYNISLNGRESNPDAPVDIIVYTDYLCPYSRQQHQVLEQVITEYFDVVNIAIRHAPGQSGSAKAAMAAECAREQDGFWEYSGQVFAKTPKSMEDYLSVAGNIGIDTGRFSTCMQEQETMPIVRGDVEDAQQAGIQGTPTVIIDGERTQGVVSYDEMERRIKHAIE